MHSGPLNSLCSGTQNCRSASPATWILRAESPRPHPASGLREMERTGSAQRESYMDEMDRDRQRNAGAAS